MGKKIFLIQLDLELNDFLAHSTSYNLKKSFKFLHTLGPRLTLFLGPGKIGFHLETRLVQVLLNWQILACFSYFLELQLLAVLPGQVKFYRFP